MLSKRIVVAGLVALNALLLTAVVLTADILPKAHAQRRGAAGDYVAVTCRADQNYDVLYIIDLSKRNLHCFVPDRNRTGTISDGGKRDLARDFR